MKKLASTPIVLGSLALLVGAMFAAPPADARRIGHVHVHPHARAHIAAHNVRYRHGARVVARDVRRAGRWVNGVWIVNGVAASVAVGATNCSYYWRRWKQTGSAYWHDRYYENCR
jgi:hypothetical protein